MELVQLQYFIKVAEEMSFSAAARKLHMTQPPLSLQIRHLESELGALLFLRNGKSISLTDAGRQFYRRAQAILDMTSLAREEARSVSLGYEGALRIGMTSSSGCRQIRETLLRFHEAYPRLQFILQERDTYALLEMMRHDQIDVAFVRTPFQIDDLSTVDLYTEPIVAVGNKEFFETEKVEENIKSLSRRSLLIYRRWKKVLEMAFSDKGVPLHPLLVADDARTCLSFALSGLGIALLPSSTLENELAGQLTVRRITDLGITSCITLVRRKTDASENVNAFFEFFGNSRQADGKFAP